jgi:DNA primase
MQSDGTLLEIKSRVDIVDVVSDYVPLKRAGRNHKGLCPFHTEKTPSFMVNAEKQIFHCFGCGAGGDIFTFIMKKENMEFREALEILAKRAGVELKQERPEDRSERERLRNIQAEALRYFQANLKKAQRALQYLKKRGVTGESMEAFSLGYAPRGWHLLIDHLKKKGFSTGLMIKAGVAASGQKGPYDIFRERIIFPIFDLHGAPVAFGGRVMDDAMPKYLNSPDTPLFRKGDTLYALGEAREEIRARGYAVVVEGYLDAIMCHQYGVCNVVAPLGTALTGAHLRKLSPLARNILLVFDGDQAGVAAARRSLEMALEGGLRGKVLVLPPGEDPDSILSTKGAGHFMELMGRASTPVEFMLSGGGTSGQEGVRQTVALAAKLSDPIFRDEIIRELAERSGTRELALREALTRYRKTGSFPEAGRRVLVYDEETILLSAALSVPEKKEEILGRVGTEDMENTLVRNIFSKLAGRESSREPFVDADWSAEERELVSRLAVSPGFDAEHIDRNIEDCIRKISRRRLEERIRNAESRGDLKLLNELYSERQKLTQEAS